MQKQAPLLLILILVFFHGHCQIINSITPNIFFQGENYPKVKVYGTSLNYSTLNKRVYGVYLKHQITSSIVSINDTTLYPNSPLSANNDSISIVPAAFVPVNADTGMYDLILISIGSFNPPGNYSYDTLVNAVRIIASNGNFKGKIFHDKNLNKIFDNGDSAIVNFSMYYDNRRAYNIQYNSSCDYYIPSMNGTHVINIVPLPPMVLFTDSASYTEVLNNNDVVNLDFGLTEGFYGISPDTVHQNDSVTFDLLSWNLFNTNFNGVEVRDSNNNLVNIFHGTQVIDTNHIQEQVIVSFNPGKYYLNLITVGGDVYPLSYNLIVLPNATSIDNLNHEVKWIEEIHNPISGDFIIYKNIAKDLYATLYDVTGKIFLSEKIESRSQILHTSTLKSGIYFLKINYDNLEYKTFRVLLNLVE